MFDLDLTHTFTGRDIRDAAAPDVIYKAHLYWSRDARRKAFVFIQEGPDNPEMAMLALSELLISVQYRQKSYDVTYEWLQEYKEGIEKSNPGMSDYYICQITADIINHQYLMEEERLKNLPEPLSQSENGNGTKQEKLAEKA